MPKSFVYRYALWRAALGVLLCGAFVLSFIYLGFNPPEHPKYKGHELSPQEFTMLCIFIVVSFGCMLFALVRKLKISRTTSPLIILDADTITFPRLATKTPRAVPYSSIQRIEAGQVKHQQIMRIVWDDGEASINSTFLGKENFDTVLETLLSKTKLPTSKWKQPLF